MDEIVTRCGYRCDLCLAFRPNVARHPEDRARLSDGWFAYFGFRIPPEAICCDGCMSEGTTLDANCPVRPCAAARGNASCAVCDEYVCDKLRQRLVSREEIARRIGREIPEEDYRSFIEPYENPGRLEAMRRRAGR